MTKNRRSFLAAMFTVLGGVFTSCSPLSVGRRPVQIPRIPPANVPNTETVFRDVWVMFKNITDHAMSTGDTILSVEIPTTLCFISVPMDPNFGGRSWSISIRDLNQRLDEDALSKDPEIKGRVSRKIKAEIMRAYTHTSEGRSKLARSFPGQLRPQRETASPQSKLVYVDDIET